MARLRADSPEFAAWWESHDIRRSMAGQKIFYYPDRGPLRFECVTFQANDDPALKLAIYNPRLTRRQVRPSRPGWTPS